MLKTQFFYPFIICDYIIKHKLLYRYKFEPEFFYLWQLVEVFNEK